MLIYTAPTCASRWTPDLTNAGLSGANWAHADFKYAVLSGVKLEGAAF
jgi:uncharacterized protein YjbI with pentapeptide repeats